MKSRHAKVVASLLLLTFGLALLLIFRKEASRDAVAVKAEKSLQATATVSAWKTPSPSADAEQSFEVADKFWRDLMEEPLGTQRQARLGHFVARASPELIEYLLERTLGVGDFDVRVDLRCVLLARWAQMNGMAAIDYLVHLPESEFTSSQEAAVAMAWTLAEPDKAVSWFAKASGDRMSSEVTNALVSALSTQSAETVLGCLVKMEESRDSFEIGRAILTNWLEESPAKAAAWAITLDVVGGGSESTGRVAAYWAERDLSGALAWAEGLQDQELQTAALRHLGWSLMEQEGGRIPELASRFSLEKNEAFFLFLASQWGKIDPAASMAWVQSLPEGSGKNQVRQALVAALAQNNPETALMYVRGFSADFQREATASIASAWATQDPAHALQWAGNLPEAETREQAVKTVLLAWGNNDPEGLLSWIQKQPEGGPRDKALVATALSLTSGFPDIAIEAATLIQDSVARRREVEAAANAWLKVDHAAARAWLRQARLPSYLKQKLLRQ